jgi:NADP-dependent 3-hydroxy acid dehydrogenase YdfG
VAATARDSAKVQDLETQYPGRARAFTLDVTEPAEIEEASRQAIAAFGHVDILVNNAG